MSFGKCCTPANAGFWMGKEEKCSIKEKAEIEHTYKALEIVAESQGIDITEPFKELYKECLYLRVLMNWQIFKPLTEEEKAAEEERMKEYKELWKSVSEDSDFYFNFEYEGTEEDKEYEAKLNRFVEIMLTDYEQVTEEMKKEALKLFPEVFESLGNFGQFVDDDFKEVF
ncbi:hypothetical protein [Methanosarcina mazei]|uniref:Uncharacterized protein n=1 Tax=Methanosarcina mazei TaxID=2209 RepID=A0A0F8K9B5_METMZ|nr:hypothetical protein [Methanosarcina mazei]KKG75625.1 hypothetical protein DU46_17745 [Methanosarcina mazei]KKG84508.1 hypothetical protein DU61_18255 [Methanosarcina mazei]KKH07225.1 hypothetical protein DU62_16030 [Methanosarcina mazei]KKH09956.1 hypothetical protein DU51_00540 [Methanosarcina mazei]